MVWRDKGTAPAGRIRRPGVWFIIVAATAALLAPAAPAGALATRPVPVAGRVTAAGWVPDGHRKAPAVSTPRRIWPGPSDSQPAAPLGSNYETASGNSLDRDCGWSHPVPGNTAEDFWLFCDTAIDNPPGTLACPVCFTPGSTAAEGPFTAGLVPSSLSELPTPPATPTLPNSNQDAPFLANPSAQSLNCTAAGDYAARWASGAAQEPAGAHPGDLLISYTNVCVQGDGTIITGGFGVVEYDPAANTLGSYNDVFTGQNLESSEPQWLLGSPVFASDGYLYLYSGTCRAPGLTCQGGASVFLARVPAQPASWQSSSSYTFFTGTSPSGRPRWGNYASAVSDVPSAEPAGASAWAVDNYSPYAATGHQLVAVEETSIGGDYRIWGASSPAGPWTVIGSGRICAAGDGCHALIGHPELSTSSGLLVSYYSLNAHHIEVAAVPW